MNEHLNETTCGQYVLRTLTDARREELDRHLTTCPECRVRLTAHELLDRRLHHDLRAELQRASPPSTMHFEAVRSELPQARPWRWLRPALSAFAAAGGALMAVLATASLLRHVSWPTSYVEGAPASSLSVVACALFAVPVLANYQASRLLPVKRSLAYALAFLLWLGTALLGLHAIFIGRELVFAAASLVELSREAAVAWGNWSVPFLGLGWIALVIGGGEYHYTNAGEASSWRLFGLTVAVELALVLLVYL